MVILSFIVHFAQLQTKQISFIYWNKKKIYEKQFLKFLNTKCSLHSSHITNLTALNGSEGLLIRELVVIRISLLKQPAPWLLSSTNLLSQIWTFSQPLACKLEPSGESSLAIYCMQKKCCSFFPLYKICKGFWGRDFKHIIIYKQLGWLAAVRKIRHLHNHNENRINSPTSIN